MMIQIFLQMTIVQWEALMNSKHFTPLRISNAQPASPRSLITAHFVGVLNVQMCNCSSVSNLD